jgi:hypothetical protein
MQIVHDVYYRYIEVDVVMPKFRNDAGSSGIISVLVWDTGTCEACILGKLAYRYITEEASFINLLAVLWRFICRKPAT